MSKKESLIQIIWSYLFVIVALIASLLYMLANPNDSASSSKEVVIPIENSTLGNPSQIQGEDYSPQDALDIAPENLDSIPF